MRSESFPVVTTPMLPANTFTGKTAFVTGGGTGLGKAMATMLSHLGCNVFIVSRRLPVLEAAATEISEKTGNRVVPCAMDVRDPEVVKNAVDICVKELGLPNIVINNAAGNFISPTERLSPNAFRTVVDIVLYGTANVTLDIGKRLIEAKQGAVFLAITTCYAELGSGYVVPSACGKAGVEAMTKSLSSEWGKYGIRMNIIAPGPFPTEGAWDRLVPKAMNGEGKTTEDGIPVGRVGEHEEIANLACYLVSDYSSFMSGEVICFDGGQRRKICGLFNRLDDVPKEQWDTIEQNIRAANQKSKQLGQERS